MSDTFGKRYGQYVVLEQLGEGGMARVYNALDSRTHQNVAIKVILPGKRTSKVFLEQFEKEAKALANLTHSNIVKVLDYGIQDGQPYLVMEYVPGGSLKDAMKHKIPWQTAAAFLAPIARALDYVHKQQIVHRDVKPSNILLQDDFRPMLADFGIVKLLESKDEKVEGAIGAGVGTPEYMPPEQGMGKDVDFRVDIYSLGLVFYEMITGQKPYTADSPIAVVIKHVTDKLPLPTKIDKTIPKYVENVILRAVQKDPRNRFTSMAHFAEALELIALGERASGRKITRISKQKERQQRSRSIYLLTTLLVLLVGATSLITYKYMTGGFAASTPPAAVVSPATSKPNQVVVPTVTLQRPATLAPTQTQQSLPSPFPTLRPLSEMPLLGTELPPNASGFTEIARWGIGGLNAVRWSPDGKTLALGTSNGVYLYDAQSHELQRFINTGFNVLELSFNPVAEELAAGSPAAEVRSWNYITGEPLQNFAYKVPAATPLLGNSPVTAISYSLDGGNLAVGYENGTINYFAKDQGSSLQEFANPPTVSDLAISADGRLLYTSNKSNKVEVWNLQNGKKEQNPLTSQTSVQKLRFSANRDLLLASGSNATVYLWDPNASAVLSTFPSLGGLVNDFDFSFDNKYIAVGLANGEIKVFETPAAGDGSASRTPIASFPAYSGPIPSLAFSPTELVLAAGNRAESLKLFDPKSGKKIYSMDNSMGAIEELYFSDDGTWLATSHDDGLVRIWDVKHAKQVHQVEGYLSKGSPFSPDNRFLAFVQSPGNNLAHVIRILDLTKMDIVARLSDYKQHAFIQFRDDSRLMVMGDEYSAKAWDVATWQELNIHGGPTAGCGQFFTPQNNLVAVIAKAGVLFGTDDKIRDMCGTNAPGATLKYFFWKENILVFVTGDGKIWRGNAQYHDFSQIGRPDAWPTPDDIFLAGDRDSGWYVYADVPEENKPRTLHVQNINSSSDRTTIEDQEDYQYRVALLPSLHWMALGSKYGSIHIWWMP